MVAGDGLFDSAAIPQRLNTCRVTYVLDRLGLTDDERTRLMQRAGGRALLEVIGDVNPARLPGASRFKRSGPLAGG